MKFLFTLLVGLFLGLAAATLLMPHPTSAGQETLQSCAEHAADLQMKLNAANDLMQKGAAAIKDLVHQRDQATQTSLALMGAIAQVRRTQQAQHNEQELASALKVLFALLK